MLLGWVGVALVLQHFERDDELLAGVARLDHLVHIATGGGDVGVGELLLIFGDQLLRVAASGSAAWSISSLKMILTAPSTPMTAISAVGQA